MPPHRLKPLLTTVAEHIDLIVQLSHSEGTLSMADILHACDETGVPPEAREALSKRLAAQRIETCNSQLEKMGVAHIHTRLTAGVSLKIAASLCALNVSNHCETSNQGNRTLISS